MLTTFRIYTKDPTHAVVELDGVEVQEHLRRATVDFRSNEVPALHLEVMGGPGTIEGEGIVYVTPDAPGIDLTEVVPAFLAAIDPQTLEQAVLERMDGFSAGTIETALAVLKEWAGGN